MPPRHKSVTRSTMKRERIKNILYVIGGMYIGGAETVIASLCRHIDKKRFNVAVHHLKGMGEIGQALLNEGFHVAGAPELKRPRKYTRFLSLGRAISEGKIDIVHSHDTASLVDAASCRLLSGRFKHVHTFHYGNYPNLTRSSYMLQKAFWRFPHRLVAVGVEQKKQIQHALGIKESRIETIWNGVAAREPRVDRKELTERLGLGDKVLIGSISTLTRQKGITHLLDTAHALKRTHDNFAFVVAGDGPLRRELEEKSRALGLEDTVFFLGWVEDASSRLMPVFDIFYQPSLWEAMSVVVIEAMSAGKPVVATDAGENRHIIRNGKSGLIIKTADIAGAAAALSRLIDDAGLRSGFGVEAKAFYESNCMVGHMVKKYEDLYSELLA